MTLAGFHPAVACWFTERIGEPTPAQRRGWVADLGAFEALVLRFVEQEERTDWPEHALFGPMTRRSWAVFATGTSITTCASSGPDSS